jgi:hypothetical protein
MRCFVRQGPFAGLDFLVLLHQGKRTNKKAIMQYLYNLEESEYSIWGFGIHYFLGELD